MATSFYEHFERAREALDEAERGVARAECESALAVATDRYQTALALAGLAETCFFDGEEERALGLLDQAIALCLPQDSPDNVNTSYALAQAWDDKAMFLNMMRRDDEARRVLDELLHRLLD